MSAQRDHRSTEDTQEFDVAQLFELQPTCEGMADIPSALVAEDDQEDEGN
jgi:hypothetical protein